jgi:hypothetical protein
VAFWRCDVLGDIVGITNSVSELIFDREDQVWRWGAIVFDCWALCD